MLNLFIASINITPLVMGVGRGAVAPWIFKHGTNIVDRGLNLLFFGLFLLFFDLFIRCPPLSWKRLNSTIFRYFLLIFSLFFVGPRHLKNFLPTPLRFVPRERFLDREESRARKQNINFILAQNCQASASIKDVQWK